MTVGHNRFRLQSHIKTNQSPVHTIVLSQAKPIQYFLQPFGGRRYLTNYLNLTREKQDVRNPCKKFQGTGYVSRLAWP